MCRDVIENPRDCHWLPLLKVSEWKKQETEQLSPKRKKKKKKTSVKFAVSILRLKFLITNSLVW